MKFKKGDHFIVINDMFISFNGWIGICIGRNSDYDKHNSSCKYEGRLISRVKITKENSLINNQLVSYIFNECEVRKLTKKEAMLELL